MKLHKSMLLRQLLRKPQPLRLIGAHDGLSAKLGEEAGFDAVWASGFEISAAYALPDANILTMTEYLEAATVMNDAISIPVVADCDTGYGNSNNVIQLVKKYEAAGIAAVCIEDKLFPKVNSFIAGRQELAPIAEFVGKILAAKNAQTHDDFMVFARVEALIAGWGMEEALTRARAYAGAGADGILIHSKLKTPDEIYEFVGRWDLKPPLIIVPTTYPDLDFAAIEKLKKVKLVIYANQGLRSAVTAMQRDLKQIITEGGTVELEKRIVPMSTVFELQGMYEMKQNEKKFLRSGKEPCSALIIAAGDHKHGDLISTVLRETPLVMLDINGQSLLERNIKSLVSQGVGSVRVVCGYQHEQVCHPDIEKTVNEDYRNANSLHSLMLGLADCHERTLVCFGDILFEKEIVRRLLEGPPDRDVVLAIDRAYADGAGNTHKSDPDLVETHFSPVSAPRPLNIDRENLVIKIGKSLEKTKPLYEFNGMFLLSQKGVTLFKQEYQRAKVQYADQTFYGAESLHKASVTHFIQYLIEKDYPIHTLEVLGGWQEIHTFHDYQHICEQFAALED